MDIPSVMVGLVDKYSADFPARTCDTGIAPNDGEHVLLTGSTGVLGSYVLAALIKEPRVKKIYLFNRPNKVSGLLERQRASLLDRGLDPELVEDAKVVFLEGLTYLPKLGLSDTVYEELQSTLTCIIHAAWPVNFHKPLLALERHIAGSRRLLDLALTSRKDVHFMFTSSIASVMAWSGSEPVLERLYDPQYAVGTGYGESKWVVEQLLARASDQNDLRTTTLRVGQLCGSTVNGAWNATEWFPRLVQTGFKMGKLILLEDRHTVSWFPVDAAAALMLEVLLEPPRSNQVVSIAHPTPSKWNVLMRYIGDFISKAGRSIEYTSLDDWILELERLSSLPSASSTYSALLLLYARHGRDLMPKPGNNGLEAMGMPKLETGEMCKLPQALRDMPLLARTDVDGWMRYWERSGMFRDDENRIYVRP